MDAHEGCINNLCAELRTIVADELAAGNRIARVTGTEDDWPLVVLLSEPFRCSHDPLPPAVRFRNTNSRTRWKAHYIHLDRAQIVACGFGDEPPGG